VLKKPILNVEGVSKIAVNVRQAYLDRFFDACACIYPDDADARQRVSIAAASTDHSILRFIITNSIILF